MKCPKRFVNNKGKCVHKKCVAKRRNGIRKCEKDGEFYCMKDDEGKINCKPCLGQEDAGVCTLSECVKPNTTNPVTKCNELGGVCRKVGRVVTCIQDDDRRPGNKSHRTKLCRRGPKVDGRRGNKTDDDMKGGRNKTDEEHGNEGGHKGDKGDGKGDRKDDKGDSKGDRKDDKNNDKDDRKNDKGDGKDGRDDDKDYDDDDDDKDDDDKKRRGKN